MSWLPQNWRDPISLVILVGVPLYIWLAQPVGELVGVLAGGWVLVVQFYFRRKDNGGSP